SQIAAEARSLKQRLDDLGLKAEFVAPRLWEDSRTIDGGYTSNDPACREYAIERSKICIDITKELGIDLVVLWLAREGTYIREAKDSKVATDRLVDAINVMLAHDPDIRICVEPKPNEPMDHAYIPTTGHAIALGMLTDDANRVGVNIESAHAILAGLDPSDEMGFALAHNKLWTVHLNDQNGLKFDQDKSFGSVDLRRALNQVRILDQHDYGKNGEWVGLDVKAMRTQKDETATAHLSNSLKMFNILLDVSRSIDETTTESLINQRDYEALDLYIMRHIMGK
ncbi:MAG: TIM barrel protein, partial [Cyclobacteriaceae bacterium]|nr:TIM barrel protein [Cyclobacteriaceae bacterium]